MKYEKITLFIILGATFLTSFMSSALTIVVPEISKDLDISMTSVNWIITSYTLSIGILNIPIGIFSDFNSIKNIFILGNIIFTISTLGCSLTHSIIILSSFRIIQGIGASAIFATYNALLFKLPSNKYKGKTIGFSSAAVFLGLSLGPLSSGLLTKFFNWQSVFILIGIISLIISLLAIKYMKIEKCSINNHLNLKNLPKFKHNVIYEYSVLTALFNYIGTFSIGYLASLQLQLIYNVPLIKTSFLLIVQPVIQAISSPIIGKLSDKIYPAKLSSIGIIMSCLGLVFFLLSLKFAYSPFLYIGLGLSGLGFSFFSSPNTLLVINALPKTRCCFANALLSTLRMIGNTVSIGIITLLSKNIIGDVPLMDAPPHLLKLAINYSYLIFIAITMLSIYLSVKTIKLHNEELSS